MIYVVSGYPRSGTSMMMRILQEGGIPLHYHDKREQAIQKRYPEGNPDGYYEVLQKYWKQYCYTDEVEDGHAVKIFTQYLPIIGIKPTTVFWMRRDPEEIQASFLKAFGRDLHKMYKDWPEFYRQQREAVGKIIRDRTSITVVELEYRNALTDPQAFIGQVSEYAPINSRAVEVIR